ncbi:COG4223 family protein [Alsobacter sp. R-9]
MAADKDRTADKAPATETEGAPTEPAAEAAGVDRGSRRKGGRREMPVIELKAEPVTDGPAGEPSTQDSAATEALPAAEASPMSSVPSVSAAGPAASEATAPAVEPAAEPAPVERDIIVAATPEPTPAAEPEAPLVAPVSSRVQRGPSVGVPIAMGIVGGIIGAGLIGSVLMLVGPFADLPDRLTSIETNVGDRAPRKAMEAVEKRAQAAEAALQSLRTDLTALAGRPQVAPGDITALTQRIERLDRATAQLASRAPAPADGSAPPPAPLPPVVVAGKESAALAVAMLIRDAVGRGAPYGRELAALEAGGADAATVAKLKPFAASGAPQAPALATAFAPLAVSLASGPAAPANAGVVDRVSTFLSGVVRVRPIGEATGEKPAAIGARAEAALRRGDLAAAAKDLEALPPESRATVQPFLDRLKARLAAGQAADALVATAVEQVIAATAASGVPTR